MSQEEWIEVGCTVWSRTMQDSAGFRGGCVIAIDPVARTVEVLERILPRSTGPETTTLAIDDLDHGLTTFYTKNAAINATNLFGWLGSMKAKDRRDKTRWAELAVRLQAIADAATLTPAAEERYRAASLEERLGMMR